MPINSLKKALRGMSVLVLATAAGFAGSAQAAKMGVRVLDANSGLPVPFASVCLGTADKPALYGTGVTSFNGVALYDNVPDRSVLITVSKKNFRGISLQKPPKGNNVVLDVLVTEGLSSKKCRALKMVDFDGGITSEHQKAEWPMRITGQTYFPAGRDGMSFLTYATGKPTHYRVSTDIHFRDAEWLPFSDVIHFSPRQADYGKTNLYFQLRKTVELEGGKIESVSQITSRTVNIARS